MSRPTRYHSAGGDLIEALILLILAVGLMFILVYCQRGERADCEAREGVWLVREAACVQAPPKGDR